MFSSRPWDAHNDISTYERDLVICTKTRHRSQNLNNTNKSSSRNNSVINPAGIGSKLTRGPSPSLNNIREDSTQYTRTSLNTPTSVLMQPDDVASVLKRMETTLSNINQRLELHEKDLNFIRNNRIKNENNQPSKSTSYVQLILIIIVAIILKYIFH